MSEDSGEKTEEPTAKKVEDALSKGQTPASREPGTLASLVVLLFWLLFGAGGFLAAGAALGRSLWQEAGTLDLSVADAVAIGGDVSARVALALAPLLAGLMVAGALAGLVQAEPRFVFERIRPKASHVSFAKGWARVFGKRGLVEFAKALFKIGVAGTVAVVVLRGAVPELAAAMRRPPETFLPATGALAVQLVAAICVTMVLVAVADIVWSRRVWREQLKMTRKEVTDETKQSEGDPILKARRLSLARDRSRRRMMEAVPSATLVIANPTHVAVALRYRHEEDAAPVVVAKGGDHLCLRIRAIAEESGVPVLERIDLARALYKVAEVDRPIPEAYFRAVAELINFVMDPARRR